LSNRVLVFGYEILLVVGVALAYLIGETSYVGYERIFGFLLTSVGVYAICGYRFRKQPGYVGYLLGAIAVIYWGTRDIAFGYFPSIDSSLLILDPIFIILVVVGGVLAVVLSGPSQR
jgi:hypothetical protein